jgi:DNA invertase Pin-like site-specific DNA recombinase
MGAMVPIHFRSGFTFQRTTVAREEQGMMTTRKLVTYRRCSTNRQGLSGLGLDAQTEAVETYAQSIGAVVVKVFTEVESGRKADRPELARALAFARRAGAGLAVARLDRLARSVHFVSGLLEAGCDFVAVDCPEANRTMLQMMAVIAEYESRVCRLRTVAALAQAKARGTLLGASRPGAPTLTVEAAIKGRKLGEAVRVEKARKGYEDLAPWLIELRTGGASLWDIARELNAEGHCTRRGKSFTATQVSRILDRFSTT